MNNEDIIKKYIKLLRNKYDMGLYPRYVERYCNECDLENFLFADKNNLGYEQIHFYNLGFKEPFHRASLIGFNTKNGPEWFIIDPTYGQFFENKYFKNYMFKYHNNFSISILKHGYIKCSLLHCFYIVSTLF